MIAHASDQDREEHERWEREQALLHPRGELSAEQIARTQAEPQEVLWTDPVVLGDVEAEFVRRLHDAKKLGDLSAVLQIEREYAVYRGEQLSFANGSSPDAQRPIAILAADGGGERHRWLPHEFLVSGETNSELKPDLASDSEGNLYAAIQVEESPGIHSCVVMKSTNDGEHWSRLFYYLGPNLINPSITIAEGAENWLFLAFHDATNEVIYVARYELADLPTLELTEVMSYPPGLSNPRLVSDSAEYTGWYAYLVFNAIGVDNWVFMHSRTLDYGDTWTEPEMVGIYCGYPDLFYDASEAHPDIEFGSGRLYIAFDNYSSSCTSTSRDVSVLISETFGSIWSSAIQLTSDVDDEHDPAIAAVKLYPDNRTVVVAYTRFWDEEDDDVWYRYTQDGGATWPSPLCIACSTVEERNVNLATSNNLGSIHAVFWDEMNINYAWVDYATPVPWSREDSLCTVNTVSDIGVRPGILVDPTMPVAEEAGIAWTDERLIGSDGYNIYYDAAALPEPDLDFYVYSFLNPGVGSVCGMDGFVDEYGQIEGIPGAEYLFFTGGPLYEGDITAYVYRVETDGDPNTHPDNPLNTGPIAPRMFTLVSTHFLGHFASAHDNAFYVDETGVYYGASDNERNGVPGWATFMGCAIHQWDFDWNPIGSVVSDPAPGTQTIARNPANGDWWAGNGARRMFRWDGASWVEIFKGPNLAGSHHDGLEVINGSLYVSDMTSDVITQYRLDDLGDPLDPAGSPCKSFFYSHGPSVEGMGYGPNDHIWISSGGATFYEIGGGALQLALVGIPDQCVLPGEEFELFDLDDFVVGLPPYEWSWEGNVDLNVSVDINNVVTVTYPPNWQGQETITFTVTDGLERVASDQAIFTVSAAPVVGDIPDQTAPFVPFDLDDYLLESGPAELIDWAASGAVCLEVSIDPVTHVVTVSDPGCEDPEDITFTAFVVPCEETMSDSDVATFDPGVVSTPIERPTVFTLERPVPSPTTREARIAFSIPSGGLSSDVRLTVYDVTGHLVRTLIDGPVPEAAIQLTWDGTNDNGLPVSSGTYFLQLDWNGKLMSRRVVLLR